MKTRPTSVTVISWFVIITGALGIISTILMIANPQINSMVRDSMQESIVSASILYVFTFILQAAAIFSAFAMLKGQNWGRFLFVGCSIASIIFATAASPVKTGFLSQLILLGVALFFLYRPKASDYFAG